MTPTALSPLCSLHRCPPLARLFLLIGMMVGAVAAAEPVAGPMPAKLAAADYHLFIIAGQSNAWGYVGNANEGLDEPVPTPEPGTVFFFDKKRDAIVDASTVHDAAGGEYNGAVAGFTHRFAIDYHKATGKKVLIVHLAPGNSGVIPGQSYGGGNWPDQYRGDLKAKYDACRARADGTPAIAGKYAFAGLIWGQGEAEVFLLENRTKTMQDIENALSALFDSFVADYGHDYAGRDGELIRVVLVSVFAFSSMSSHRFSPDSIYWAASRDVQRHVADRHPQARMVYSAIETFFYQGVWGPNNAVHYKQSQYNRMGAVIAKEAVAPFSTILPPVAPTGLTATAASPWRVDLAWKSGAIPGELPVYRIYRRRSGQDAAEWTWLWQLPGKSGTIFHDENAVEPGAAYEYRVSARNEFGEEFSATASAVAGSLAPDPVAAYVQAAAPADAARVRALWKALADGGHLRGLRSLHLMVPGLNAASGKIFNLVRTQDQAGLYDLDANDAVVRAAAGFEFRGAATATAPKGLLPTTGPSTVVVGFDLITEPTGDLTWMGQGFGYPYSDLDGVERFDLRTCFSYDRSNRRACCYQEQIQGFTGAKDSIVPGVLGFHALAYDGLGLRWNAGALPAVAYGNDLYFREIGNAPFQILVNPSNGDAAFRIPVIAVWNRGLDEAESAQVRALLAGAVAPSRK